MSCRIEQLFLDQASHQPDAIAIFEGGTLTSYGALAEQSAGIAAALADAGVAHDQRVALFCRHSARAIAALLGVMRAGAIYAPVDINSPAPRVQHILSTLQADWIVADAAAAPLLQALSSLQALPPVFWLGDALEGLPSAAEGLAGRPGAAPSHPGGSDDLAYIIFTSGSTGIPKGVPIRHGGVVQLIDWVRDFLPLQADDRVSGSTPLHFDVSVFDIFATFAAGATLYPVPPSVGLMPPLTTRFIRENALTQWCSVPALFVGLATRGGIHSGALPSLRRMIWAGDVLSPAHLRTLMVALPHVNFVNLYGPTEGTIATTFYSVPAVPEADGSAIPIGVPAAGDTLVVFDDAMAPVPAGVEGELYISGTRLSPGYLNNPERTAAAFVEHPPGSGVRWYRTGDRASQDAEGRFHFHGRADRQIKSRGYRIELDEVAAAISRLPVLQDAAVVGIPVGGMEGKQIGAVYVPAGGAAVTPLQLNKLLAAFLPRYMLPRVWKAVSAIPRTPSGKSDYPAIVRFLQDGQGD